MGEGEGRTTLIPGLSLVLELTSRAQLGWLSFPSCLVPQVKVKSSGATTAVWRPSVSPEPPRGLGENDVGAGLRKLRWAQLGCFRV
jgi:hypothetical protein